MMDDRNQLTACTQSPGHHAQEPHPTQPADVHSLPVFAVFDCITVKDRKEFNTSFDSNRCKNFLDTIGFTEGKTVKTVV